MKNSLSKKLSLIMILVSFALECTAQRISVDKLLDFAAPKNIQKLSPKQFSTFLKEKFQDSTYFSVAEFPNKYRVGEILFCVNAYTAQYPPTSLQGSFEYYQSRDFNITGSPHMEEVEGRKVLIVELLEDGVKSYKFITVNSKNTIMVLGKLQCLKSYDFAAKEIILNFMKTARYKE